MQYIRHIRTNQMYSVISASAKSRVHSDSWTPDVVVYKNEENGEVFVTDMERIKEAFIIQ